MSKLDREPSRSEFNGKSFVERCSRGEAVLDDVEEYVERWHRSSFDVGLDSYLGMTKEEYELWLRDPCSLASIVAARRQTLHSAQ
jgi:hypothetical protein